MGANVTVIILTFNDERNIVPCLESAARLSDDVVIVDSFSTDQTLEIARSRGCRIFQNPFVNQAHQFNWALDNVEPRHEWILRLDSDEVIPDALAREIAARAGAEAGIDGYYLNRRMYWMNRWLRHGRMYPHYILRLFRRGRARYELRTEEHLILQGEAGYMKCDFLEDNRNNTLDYFTIKHLKTAQGEVDEIMLEAGTGDAIEPRLFGTKVQRTRWLKEKVYARAPGFIRPYFYFVYRYVFCAGFLDGKEGLIFHVLQGFWYRFYIDAKLYEKRIDWVNRKNEYRNI